MNIIKRELMANLKSLIIWCVVFICILAMAAFEFEALKNMADVDKLLQSFPPEFQKAFSFDMIRFDKPEGYYSYIAQYFVFMASVFATLLGCKMLSKEISKKTAEKTFTLPVTRRYIIFMKLIAALINCVLLTGTVFAASYLIFSSFDVSDVFLSRMISLSLLMLLLEVLFLSLGLFVSVLTRSHKRTGTVMVGITVAFYMISFIAKMSEKYEILKYFTPFEYFNTVDILHGNNIEMIGFIIVPVLIVIFFFISFKLVEKKDIL